MQVYANAYGFMRSYANVCLNDNDNGNDNDNMNDNVNFNVNFNFNFNGQPL